MLIIFLLIPMNADYSASNEKNENNPKASEFKGNESELLGVRIFLGKFTLRI